MKGKLGRTVHKFKLWRLHGAKPEAQLEIRLISSVEVKNLLSHGCNWRMHDAYDPVNQWWGRIWIRVLAEKVAANTNQAEV